MYINTSSTHILIITKGSRSIMKLISFFILSICAIVVCILGIIGVNNKYIKLYWGIFWWRYAAGFIVAIYVMQQKDVLKLIFLWLVLGKFIF